MSNWPEYLQTAYGLSALKRGLAKRRYKNEDYASWAWYGDFNDNLNWRPTINQAKKYYEEYTWKRRNYFWRRNEPKLSFDQFVKYWNNLANGTKWVYASVLYPFQLLPKDNILQNETINKYWKKIYYRNNNYLHSHWNPDGSANLDSYF